MLTERANKDYSHKADEAGNPSTFTWGRWVEKRINREETYVRLWKPVSGRSWLPKQLHQVS